MNISLNVQFTTLLQTSAHMPTRSTVIVREKYNDSPSAFGGFGK